MKRAEITRKFDEIVAFAEVERFIDTPVKHYSSGMYLRLAFAVAAHLEPEILLVDEVLAVGDARSRRSASARCARSARAAGRCCSSATTWRRSRRSATAACYISEGRLGGIGTPHEMIGRIWPPRSCRTAAAITLSPSSGRRAGSEDDDAGSAHAIGEQGAAAAIRMGTSLSIDVEYRSDRRPLSPVLGVVIKNNYGVPLFGINNRIVPGFQFERLHRQA